MIIEVNKKINSNKKSNKKSGKNKKKKNISTKNAKKKKMSKRFKILLGIITTIVLIMLLLTSGLFNIKTIEVEGNKKIEFFKKHKQMIMEKKNNV